MSRRDPSPPARLGRGTLLAYALGSVGTGVFTTVPGLLLLTFMVRHLRVPAGMAGLVILLPRLWDVVTDPVVGQLSDRTRTRIGARRPWLLAGGLVTPVLLAALFRVPGLSGTAAAVYVLAVYVAGALAFTMFQVPYVALPAELTDDPGERTTIVAWRIAFLTVGILVAGGAAPALVEALGGGRRGYAGMGVAVGAVVAVAMLGCFAGLSRAPVVEPAPADLSIRGQLRAAVDNRPFRWLLSAFMIQALAVGAMLACVDFFAVYVLGDGRQTAVLFVCLVGPAIVAMPLWARVGHRVGKRAGFTASTLLFAAASLSLAVAGPGPLVYAQVLVAGVAYAGTQMFPLAMLPDTIAADTARTGLRRAGAFTGVWTAGEKAGFALGPALLAALLAVTGFVETEGGRVVAQPPAALLGLRLGFAVLPAVVMLASLWPLARYELDLAAPGGEPGAPRPAPSLEPGAPA